MIVAAIIGNVLEWFDFLVYCFFAVTIAEVFFPFGNPTVSLLIAPSEEVFLNYARLCGREPMIPILMQLCDGVERAIETFDGCF